MSPLRIIGLIACALVAIMLAPWPIFFGISLAIFASAKRNTRRARKGYAKVKWARGPR